MKKLLLYFAIIFTLSCAQSQDRSVGGLCEGCEAVHEYGNQELNNIDTLPSFYDQGPQMKVTGTIFKKDGKTPAKDVILYVYHTDKKGIYPTKGDEKGWARRHGYIRGWIKTNKDGKYTFYTTRPASYPNTDVAQHIHATIKEPGIQEYYIDAYHFDDDPNFSNYERNSQRSRGGSGIVLPQQKGDILVIKRDIVLGKNIPNY